MATISTILSKKDADLLEQAIAQYGHLVSTDDLKHVLNGKYQNAELRQQIARLAQRGWLVRIKRGLYAVISDITTLAPITFHYCGFPAP
jgi:predicted transcriptional regulator of viral defense system